MSARLQEGISHIKANQFRESAEAFRDVLKDEPENPDALHFLGISLWNLNQTSEALVLIKQSMEIAPDRAHMHHNLGGVLSGTSDVDAAVVNYKRAIELKGDYAEAYFNLGAVYKFKKTDPLIATMKSLYSSSSLSDADQEYLCFALSKALNDTEVYEEAFHFALEAARLKNPDYNPNVMDVAVKEALKAITKEVLSPVKGRGNNSETPIFIVGMPRSGTTLVEQILSRHPQVFAAGELPMIGSINSQMREFAKQNLAYKGSIHGFIPMIPPNHFNNAADACMDMIHSNASGKSFTRFTDKMPQNVFHLGFISMMFPNARIIHVRRHPLDTCVSCFLQRFRLGHEYTYRLDWLGQYYRRYVKVFDHWRKVVPLPILEVRYEELVNDLENEARKLIEFTGLDWSDDCLSPQYSNRPVRTASRWQVRQPIYNSSINRWKYYEAWLSPLISELGGMDWIEQQIEDI